jgi:protoheme IX farnesyltransferase
LASGKEVDIGLYLAMLAGLMLVIGSACVFNNYLDRKIDKKMARTKTRALAVGDIKPTNALIYGGLLALVGFSLLSVLTNWVAAAVAALGFIDYVLVYSFLKRFTPAATIIGSIAGATPLVVGYCSVTGQLDSLAVLLFLAMSAWQMPHFYAIAIFRSKDYQSADIPVLPVIKGIASTKIRIYGYIVAYSVVLVALAHTANFYGLYFLVLVLLGPAWLSYGLIGLDKSLPTAWAKAMFKASLIVLIIFSLCLSVFGIFG